MRPTLLFAALLLSGTQIALAAPAGYLIRDHSTSTLIDPTTAAAVLTERLPVNLKKLYSVRKWGFLSEVEGGFDEGKVCVITARTMLLPRAGKNLVFDPAKTATTFGSLANATTDQCKALAKAKLAESVEALRFALVGR